MTTPRPTFRKDRLGAIRQAALGKAMRPVPAQSDVTATDGLQTLRDAPTATKQFLDGHRAALAAAMDPNLNEAGRAARHGELRQAAQDAAVQKAAELRQSVDQAASAVHARAAFTRHQPAPGVEGMMGRQIAWNRTREMIDAGVTLHEVIGETTDPEALHSMMDELPSHLRTKGNDYAPGARAEVLRTVEDQLAHVAGGKALDAHLASWEAGQHVAQLAPARSRRPGGRRHRPARGRHGRGEACRGRRPPDDPPAVRPRGLT